MPDDPERRAASDLVMDNRAKLTTDRERIKKNRHGATKLSKTLVRGYTITVKLEVASRKTRLTITMVSAAINAYLFAPLRGIRSRGGGFAIIQRTKDGRMKRILFQTTLAMSTLQGAD